MGGKNPICQGRWMPRFALQIILALGLVGLMFSTDPPSGVRYPPYDSVKDLIDEMVSASAPDVPADEIKDAASWNRWIQARDREIRGRVDRGNEDSISNLTLFGTSYSTLPPLPGFVSGIDASGQVTPAAQARIHALALAMLQPGENERVTFARDFLMRHNVVGDAVEGYLAGNLQRLIHEESAYENNLKAARQTGDTETMLLDRATIFKERGLSFDTSLEPDFALETMLKQLLQKGLINRGSVRRIAVIGPGLDFADKRRGSTSTRSKPSSPSLSWRVFCAWGLASPEKSGCLPVT